MGTLGSKNTVTSCGRYVEEVPDADPALVITCIRCIWKGQQRVTLTDYSGILRGQTVDITTIDEAGDFGKLAVALIGNAIGRGGGLRQARGRLDRQRDRARRK